MENKEQLYSISELAKLFNTTTRAIRFYEDKNLIHPQRIGGNRAYSYRDKARLVLIIRLKKVGFKLDQIKDYIDLYSTDKHDTTQLKHGFSRLCERIELIESELTELNLTHKELINLKNEAVEKLLDRGVKVENIFKS